MPIHGFRLERMMKPTCRVEFSKDNICKDLSKVWKEQVQSVFASHGLSCTMNEDECVMILDTGNAEDDYIIKMARRALGALACCLSAQWVKPILLNQICCDIIRIQKPEGISEEEFSNNYVDFIDKFGKSFELKRKWYCYVLYFEKCIIVVATSFQATNAVRCLVEESLTGTAPFEDYADMMGRYIYSYNEKEEVLTNNLELFCSLLREITE